MKAYDGTRKGNLLNHILVIMIAVFVALAGAFMAPSTAHAASTSPSGAETLTAGQWKSGRFTYTKPIYDYTGKVSSTYMAETKHYYKIRTGGTGTYTVKAEYTKFTGFSSGDTDSYGMTVKLLDNNYSEVQFSSVSAPPRYTHTTMKLLTGESGSMTYNNLKSNSDYYVLFNSDSGYNRNAMDYKVCYTTNATSSHSLAPVPVVTLDSAYISSRDKDNVYVSGTVSIAKGQCVGVFDSAGKVLYNYQQVGNSNGKESFRIKVFARDLADGTNTFVVKSMPVKNVINGSYVKYLTVVIGSDRSSNNNGNNTDGTSTYHTMYPVYHVAVGGSVYEIRKYKEIGGPCAVLIKAKNAKGVTIPATVKYGNTVYNVTGIQQGAFNDSKAKTVTVKTRFLTKKSVKNCFKGSKVKTVKVKVGNKALNKSFAKKYKKVFTKGNCGKKVKVKK